MTYKEAIALVNEYTYLVGDIYNNKKVSHLLILQSEADLPSIGKAAQMVLNYGYFLANQHHTDYEVFVLYDLDDWLLSEYLEFEPLIRLLKRLNIQ